jgi:hypothetical protein
MKHIFVVHTPITYLVSVSVINELKIAKEDAIILFHEFDNKNFLHNEGYTAISTREFYRDKNIFGKLYNSVHYFNIPASIDELVCQTLRQEKFVAYIPVVTPFHKAIITHSNCISFNFIEEGLAQYWKEETPESLTSLYSKYTWRSSIFKTTTRTLNEMYLLLRGYNFKLLGLPLSYSCYGGFNNITFYGLSEESFPLIKPSKKKVISFDKKKFSLVRQDYDLDLSNKIIWIGDGSLTHYGFNKELYLKGIKEGCVDFINKKGAQEIFIKFSRDESEHLRDAVKKVFYENKISVSIIPDSVIMELLLLESKNATLIGVYSSLLYYASMLGHNAFSIYEFLKEEYSRALKNRDFSFYWNKVTLIK